MNHIAWLKKKLKVEMAKKYLFRNPSLNYRNKFYARNCHAYNKDYFVTAVIKGVLSSFINLFLIKWSMLIHVMSTLLRSEPV